MPCLPSKTPSTTHTPECGCLGACRSHAPPPHTPSHTPQVYGLPLNGTRIFQSRVAKPVQSWTRTHITTPAAKALAPVTSALRRVTNACCCCCNRQQRQQQHSDVVDTLGLPPVLVHTDKPSAAAAAADSEASSSSGLRLPAVRCDGGVGGVEDSTHAAVEIDIGGLEGKDVATKGSL